MHGDNDHGFVPIAHQLARDKGVAAYVGDGQNRWTAVHRLDAARLFRLALEKGTAGARYHGTDEEGILFKDIAAVIGKRLSLPVVSMTPEAAAEHFGWFALFAAIDCPLRARTRNCWDGAEGARAPRRPGSPALFRRLRPPT